MYGLNELEVKEDDPLWKKYLEQFKEPLILLLLGSAVISVLVGQYDDAISITIAIIIVVTVAFVQEYRSEQSLQALNKLVPHRCHCTRDGDLQDCLASDLVPGDIVSFGIGDRIPADVRIIEAIDLKIEEASLTGEPKASKKHTDAITDGTNSQLAERRNMAFMGTLVRSGHGKGIVTGTGENTEFGVIFHMMKEVEDSRTPLQQDMDELGKKLSMFSFGIIGVILLIGVLQGRNLVKMFAISVSLAVAAIPEGLPIVVTVTLALGVMRMAKRNAIVKKLPAVEALGSATVICSDKTGTLTENKMTVRALYAHHLGLVAQVAGIGYTVDGAITINNAVLNAKSYPAITRLLEIGNICNNAHIRDDQVLGQPTEGSLLIAASKLGLPDLREHVKRIQEIPFSSETKWMGVQVILNPSGASQTEIYMIKGSLSAVLERSSTYYGNDGKNYTLTKDDEASITRVATQMAEQGLRVLAFAEGAQVTGMSFVGLAGVVDMPRAGVHESIEELMRAKVTVAMITGDMQQTAEAIGRQLGLFDPKTHRALSGTEIDDMSQHELENVISSVRIFYRTSPKHKMKIVKAYQNRGEVVAMTGDGVNDAPALKLAQIGVAMGKSGTDVAKEAADMILVDDNFSTIMSAIEEGKAIAYNIRNFLRFQLSTSVAALALITISTIVGFENPLNAMQILWINILMDGPPAQSLGVEPVDRDVMKNPPRSRNDPIITRALIQNVIVSASIIVLGTLFVFWREASTDYIITARDTTMTFTTFVCFDMFNALSCRSQEKSILEIGFATNTMFLWAVGGSLFGQLCVIYFPPLQAVFQTEALSLGDLVFIVCLTSSVFIVDEIRKFRRNRTRKVQEQYLPL